MIPGSNQSPSDMDTMVMVLNEAGDQFIEQYKPIDEVRTVALARLNAVYLETLVWQKDNVVTDYQTADKIWHTEANADKKEKAALDKKRDKKIAAINAETDPKKMLEIAVEPFVFPLLDEIWAELLGGTD